MKKLLTVKEVADLLQLNERTVLKMLQSAEIPGIRIGAQWRIHPVLLEDWFMRKSAADEAVPAHELALFKETHILLDLKVDQAEKVLMQMIDRLVSTGEMLYPDLFLTAILDRERMLSTGIGNGIAMPHAQHAVTQTFTRCNVVVSRLANAIPYDAVDGNPVDLFFLIAPPPADFLQTLALVNRVVRHPEVVAELRMAKTGAQASALLNAAADTASTGHKL